MAACIVCAALTAPMGCKREAAAPAERGPFQKGFIGFVGAGQDDPVWAILKAGAERFAGNSALLEVRYAAPAILSPDQQIALIRSMHDSGMRGLCVQVFDAKALRPTLAELITKGVAVVTMIQSIEPLAVSGHVGFDEQAAGRAVAEATIQVLESGGHIMVLHASSLNRFERDRFEAFSAGLKAAPQIERWAEIDCGGEPFRAREEIKARSARFPNLSAWVSMKPWPLLAWSPDVAPLPAGCRLITCPADPALWPFIESGLCPAAVGFNYYEMGSKALQFCQVATQVDAQSHREYLAPIRLVFPANLAEYRNDWASWAAPPAAVQ
ncbi:MAG: substrate-binding domain-containing protein [Phycisphaerae bacterium]|nr:substrate-binding domain-containing protein [Phycisphaerae bacterium]